MPVERIYNFSAGPAVLPLSVLERAREEMLSYGKSGMSIMEMSHRSDRFEKILHGAESGIRKLLELPANYRVLFLQGGASMQFSMIPMNLLSREKVADYIITGVWGVKAVTEAAKFGEARTIFTDKENSFRSVPQNEILNFSKDAAYVHYTSNETIEGVEFKYDLDAGGLPVVCDASSNILSKPIDVEKYALIYAGAQKNIGPSGVTVVIIREDLLEKIPDGLPTLMDYRSYANADSMPNTPNTWGIYLTGLVCEWLKERGGVGKIAEINREKAAIIYAAIDQSEGFYIGHADNAARSLMNVTFRLGDGKLEDRFVSEAEAIGLDGIRGHRSVGGIRASIYNAFPVEGAKKLAEFMTDFAAKNG